MSHDYLLSDVVSNKGMRHDYLLTDEIEQPSRHVKQ